MNTTLYDTVIIGGGPAGCATACRLALFGYRICLIERSDSSHTRAKVGASLSSRILDLLVDIHAEELLVNAGFPRTLGANVLWGEQVETRPHHGIPGFGVERGRFDELLLTHARKLGVTVIRPATVVGLERIESACGNSACGNSACGNSACGDSACSESDRGYSTDKNSTWHISVNNQSKTSLISCKFVVDASGRRRYSQQHTAKGYQKYFDTVALYAYWQVNMDPRNGLVEASDQAWYWAAFVEPDLLIAAVFVDRKQLNTNSPETLYQYILAESLLLKPVLAGEQLSSVNVCDASICLAKSAGEHGLLRVGDALLAKDPISAQGVESAVASGLSAARVIHTALQKPMQQKMAWQFYQQQHHQKYTDHLQFTSRFYEERLNVCNTPFWKNRVIHTETENNNKPIEENLPQMLRVSQGISFKEVAAIQSDIVTTVPGIELSNGEHIAFWEGELLTELLSPFRCKMPLYKALQYWRTHFPNIHGMRLLNWCLYKNILT